MIKKAISRISIDFQIIILFSKFNLFNFQRTHMISQEQIQNSLNQLQNSIVKKTEELKAIGDHADDWMIQQFNTKKNYNNGQLIYPKYDKKCPYYQEFWKIYLYNQILISKIKDFSNDNKQLIVKIQELDELQKEWSRIWALKTKKKVRRISQMIQKNFNCPFHKCGKNYGTDVALNMHMKIKHNSGTKTQRQTLAKQLVLAQLRGEKIKINLVFPPGYLQQFRQSMKNEMKIKA